ncbi:MAG: hypothetical protein ACRDX8_13820 [Acidimicrobiales bacterium]
MLSHLAGRYHRWRQYRIAVHHGAKVSDLMALDRWLTLVLGNNQ